MSMKMYKQLASLEAPTPSAEGMLAQGNAAQQSVIIVGFAHVEVYGKKNGAWELAATVLEDDKSTFVSLEEYEGFYFLSKSGKEEVLRYFFIEDSVIAPAIADSKVNSIQDIGDMPSFTAADAGKVLSVDVQGNLAWINR